MSKRSSNHVGTLLRKDWLILNRNWLYLVMFVFIPFIMMGSFWYLKSTLEFELTPEKHNFYVTKYSKPNYQRNSFLGSGMDQQPARDFEGNISTLAGCRFLRRYDIGIVAPQKLITGFKPIMEKALQSSSLKTHFFNNTDGLYHDITTNNTRKYCFAFELSDVYPSVEEVNVTILFPRDSLGGIINSERPLYDLTQRNPDFSSWNRTFAYGTTHFMVYVTDFLLLMLRGKQMNELELAFVAQKTPQFYELPIQAQTQLIQSFPIVYICIFMLPLYYMVTKLAEEKESKIRESMKMMGLSDQSYYMAWFLFNGFIGLIISTTIQLILTTDVFWMSDWYVIFAMSFIYNLNIFGISFTLTSLIPNKKGSATAASIVHLASFIFNYSYKGYGTSFFQKALIACFVPNCAVGFMMDHLLHVEVEGGTGLTIETALMEYQNFSYAAALGCQVVNIIFWGMIGIYLDKIMPRDFGKAEPWNFLCKSKRANQVVKATREQHDQELVKRGNFEHDSRELNQDSTLQIRGLKKRYASGKLAVDGVCMTMHQGEIFALLGHNGAGKTTTIGMLTGLMEPSEGYATLGTTNIFEDMSQLRENLGVCPQHNVLYGHLTVREHLEIFASLKGVKSYAEIRRRVDRMIYQIELQEVQFQLANTLSGGQKRKLSVGIALIGDTKVVLLDEPTSGMDTTTRRRFWDMIRQYKEDRIIVLTTHYMDEADILGDKICIMAEGKVQCCGSPLFLKTRFGVGYNLKLTKTLETKSQDIAKFIQTRVPYAKLLQEVSTEITWQLPEKARHKFASFFNDLDSQLKNLKLSSYGCDITSLEEVFLQIGHGSEDTGGTTIEQIRKRTADANSLSGREKLLTDYSVSSDNQRSFFNELHGMITKKVLVLVRDFKGCILDTLLPVVIIIAGLYISTLQLIPEGHPTRLNSVYKFPPGQNLHYNVENFNQTQSEIQEYKDFAFSSDIGEGKLWATATTINTNTETHFFDQMQDMDNQIFQKRNESGPFFGNFYIQQADKEERHYSIVCLINATHPSTIMSYASYALQGIIRTELENPNFRLNFLEGQLPFMLQFAQYISSGISVITIFGFTIAYMMISDTLIQSLIKEKQLGIKHQLQISGGSQVAYWLSHYLIDICTHAIPAITVCTCARLLQINVPQLEIIFTWFVFTNPVFIYTISFLFQNDGMASIFARVFYFAFGAVAPVAAQILDLVNKDTIAVGQVLQSYFVYFPIYNLNMGYIRIINRGVLEMIKRKKKGSIEPYDWICAGESLQMIQMGLLFCLAWLIIGEIHILEDFLRPVTRPLYSYLYMIDSTLQRKKKLSAYNIRAISSLDDDMDHLDTRVVRERIRDQDPIIEQERVKQVKTAAVKVANLSKAYTPFKRAVNEVSFALDYGECFALLGVTGAGKTSTFKCLTGEEIPDEGEMMMGGFNLRQSFGFASARSKVGYCPQFEAIYDGLTVREHLQLYATIKGVRQDYQRELVTRQIQDLDLLSYENVHAGTLSGGNKRKLQCAIALIGNPPIILLDEPSTGVDPQAKRFMWTVISNISTLRKLSTVILTTHSMEEAEALCPKIGIMVDGQFQCFGSSQHIKDKYSDGYDIQVKITPLTSDQTSKLLNKYGYKLTESLDESGIQDMCQRADLLHIWEAFATSTKTAEQVFHRNSPFPVVDILQWAHIESQGHNLLRKLQKTFGQASQLEHFLNKFDYKVAKAKHSIGFVFGLMEQLRTEYYIGEYSATQTTLEQIFNMFAVAKTKDDTFTLKPKFQFA